MSDFQVFGLSNWKDGVTIRCDGVREGVLLSLNFLRLRYYKMFQWRYWVDSSICKSRVQERGHRSVHLTVVSWYLKVWNWENQENIDIKEKSLKD